MSEEELRVIEKVEIGGFAFVSDSFMNARQLFNLAMLRGYGFSMEPYAVRAKGIDHPLICKNSTPQVITQLVEEKRILLSKSGPNHE